MCLSNKRESKTEQGGWGLGFTVKVCPAELRFAETVQEKEGKLLPLRREHPVCSVQWEISRLLRRAVQQLWKLVCLTVSKYNGSCICIKQCEKEGRKPGCLY